MRRVLITGSRTWSDPDTIYTALNAQAALDDGPILIVHGDCSQGADRYAHIWYWHHILEGAQVEAHPANWRVHGRKAGPVRNRAMVRLGADVVLAFIKDRSRGATGCAAMAVKAGIPVIYHTA